MTNWRSSADSSAPWRRTARTTDSMFSRSLSTSVPSRSKRKAAGATGFTGAFLPQLALAYTRRSAVDQRGRLRRDVLVGPFDLGFVDRERVVQAVEAIDRTVDPVQRRDHLRTALAHDLGRQLDGLQRRVGEVAQREERPGQP